MTKEIKMYEAIDGKLFKTKKGAENHDKKILVAQKEKELNMSSEEIQSKLEEASKANKKITFFLNVAPWYDWAPHQIKMINKNILEVKKTTKYIIEKRRWGKLEEKVLFTEEADKFTDPKLHCGDEYKVRKFYDENEYVRKVFYEDKYTEEEKAVMKLKNKESLSENEISTLVNWFEEVYREEGEARRWSRYVLSVLNIDDELYAIEWDQGLTENQENEYFNQPYPVELKEKEVTIKVTEVVPK